MKIVKYKTADGEIEVQYDENAPCIICSLPVIEASMGGTNVCSWCDTGHHRNGEAFTFEECLDYTLIMNKAQKIQQIENLRKKVVEED
jgi:hypothetical protein